MPSKINFRSGDAKLLASECLQLLENDKLVFELVDLEPYSLEEDNIIAVHYADGGAQGEGGAVRILYYCEQGMKVLYGNYVYGNLNLDAVIQKLPMLECLDSRHSLMPPHMSGKKFTVPSDWSYIYLGVMNHFYIKREYVDSNIVTFVNSFFKISGGWAWRLFDAVAWYYLAK